MHSRSAERTRRSPHVIISFSLSVTVARVIAHLTHPCPGVAHLHLSALATPPFAVPMNMQICTAGTGAIPARVTHPRQTLGELGEVFSRITSLLRSPHELLVSRTSGCRETSTALTAEIPKVGEWFDDKQVYLNGRSINLVHASRHNNYIVACT